MTQYAVAARSLSASAGEAGLIARVVELLEKLVDGGAEFAFVGRLTFCL